MRLHPAQQLVVALEKAAIDEVVALDAGEGDGVVVGPEQLDPLGVLHQRQRAALPYRPGPRRGDLHVAIGVGEAAVVSGDHVAALCRAEWPS